MKIVAKVMFVWLVFPIFVNANESHDSHDLTVEMMNHLTPLNVEVRDVTEKYQNRSRIYLERLQFNTLSKPSDQFQNKVIVELDNTEIIVDKIINIGTKIWNVLEKGKPASNYLQKRATAVPQNITSWQQLEGWSNPKSKYYEISYKNVYGIEVAKLVYKIIYLTGGQYKGSGRYIGYVSVEPQEFKTAYLYSFNVQAAVESVYNKGTSQNPIAGMIINIQWTISTMLKKETQSYSYHIDGTGQFQDL